MKIIISLLGLAFISLSCSSLKIVSKYPAPYFQLYDLNSQSILINDSICISEHGDLEIRYDFWAENGLGDFLLFNKTEKEIFVDLGRSHLVKNNIAESYYPNLLARSSSRLTEEGIDLQISLWTPTKQVSAANLESRIVCIPPFSGKKFHGFELSPRIISSCDYEIYPAKEESFTMTFSKSDTPLKFRNIVSYSFDESFESTLHIEDDFWVKEITNYPRKRFFKDVKMFECGTNEKIYRRVYNFKSAGRFYKAYSWEDIEISEDEL
jgi:hypothetical protein